MEAVSFPHLGDCMVLKAICFILQMHFAEVSHLFFVIMKRFSYIKARKVLGVWGQNFQPREARSLTSWRSTQCSGIFAIFFFLFFLQK